jgi:hypothetical protein
MLTLTCGEIAQYLRRSYMAVDGLWFMKVEERCGFDTALDIDHEVWKVMPKIQARMLKSLGNAEDGLAGLRACFATKLTLEGMSFRVEESEKSFQIVIDECPWHALMVKSGREHLSERVGNTICRTEYSTWAREFGEDIRFELRDRICLGSPCCVLHFTTEPEVTSQAEGV